MCLLPGSKSAPLLLHPVNVRCRSRLQAVKVSTSVNGISDLAPPRPRPLATPSTSCISYLHLLSASPPLMQEAGGEGKMMQRDILLVQTLEPSPALAWKLLGCDGPHL